ncbi:MAG TPA: ABC transporter substrate-binding protein, partial [Tepidisphaeraceae bacterium]
MRLSFPLILLLAAAGLLSCDRDDDAGRRVFRFINRGDIFTLDLNGMSYAQDFRLTYAIREGLYAPTGPENKPVPAGAERHSVSPDGKVYTFFLRRDAKWSNGDPVVAGDYVFSWNLLLESPGEYTYLFYAITNAEAYEKACAQGAGATAARPAIRAVDDYTLEVTLDRPVTYFLDLTAFPMFYPRHAASMQKFRREMGGRVSYDNLYTRPPAVVTNGPFKLVRWDFKRSLRLERNEHYYATDQVGLDVIENIVNDNPLSQLLQYDAGAVHWVAEVQPDLAADLR